MKNIFTKLLVGVLFVLGSFSANAQVDVASKESTSLVPYTSLKAAFDAINEGKHTGIITIGISGNTIEAAVTDAASVVLNKSGNGSASYKSITILPTGGAPRLIKGASTPGFPFIDFSGADNVFIFGLNMKGDLLTIVDTTVTVQTEYRADFITKPEVANKLTDQNNNFFNFNNNNFSNPGNNNPSNIISATTYAFTSGSGSLEVMTSGTTMLLTPDLDDAASSIAPIGFDFWFDGVRQTVFSANSNGLMKLSSTRIGTAFANDLASATEVPQIAPYWDDLWIGNNGKVHYKVVGTAPNRKLVVEWSNMQVPRVATATAGTATFQAWLYESTGMIEFVYGAIAVTTNSYSVGFGSSATQFASVTTTGPTVAYGVANNAQTAAIASGTKYTFTPLVPITPGALSFTAVGLNTMTLNWADNATNELGYAVYRSFDGVTYEFIRQLAAGSTTSVEAGLASNTTYFWSVYAVTEGSLGTATSGSQATTTGVNVGAIPVGPTGTFLSLTAAVTAINATGLAGNVILELQPAYVSGVEVFPLAITTVGSPTNTITIRPQAGAVALVIAGGAAVQTLNLNGAAYVTIDGRAGGAGVSQLTVSNTSVAGVPVQFINDARNNTLQYTTVAGVNTSATGGDIVFSTTTGSIGNSYNTIDNCDIKDGATTPANLIYSLGTAGFPNTYNTISNNLIHDNFIVTTTVNNGIFLSSAAGNLGNTRWTISGNRFYQSVARTFLTTAAIHSAITIGANSGSINSGFGYNITGNIIGFANAGGTGVYTMAGTIATRFIGINLNGGAEPSNITNNTVSGFSLATSSGAATTNGIFSGINVLQGNVNISQNTIGGTGTGHITTTPTTALALNVGISVHTNSSVAAVNITNNTIGGFTANGSGSISGIAMSAGQPTITTNTIGSNTVPLSMNSPTVAVASTLLQGINIQASTTGSVSPTVISNNIIANFSGAGTGTGAVGRGIVCSSIGPSTITNNTIHDIAVASTNTTVAGGGTAAQGILQTGTAVLGSTVSQNTIYTISATNAGAVSTVVAGIGYSNPSNGSVTKNKIYDLRNASTGTTVTAPPMAIGILIRAALGTSTTFANNMISLGTAQTTNTQFVGFMNSFNTNTIVIHYNSVHIAGAAGAGALPSYGFLRGDNGAASVITSTVDIKNNIFNNTRTGGTGKHYAIGNVNTVPATGWSGTASNNNVLNSPVAGTVGIWGLAADQTFATWKTASLGDLSSLSGVSVVFVDVTTGDLHVNFGVTPTTLESGGVVVATTVDYDNQARPGPAGSTNGGASAPDIGADEFDGVPLDLTAPTITYTALLGTCLTSDRTLAGVIIADANGVPTSGALQPRIYYKKNAGAYFSQQGVLTAGNGISGTWSFAIVNADMGGVITTDVISYFVIAQDIAPTPNIASNPAAGLVATDVNTVTTPPTTPNTYLIQGTLAAGTYTVGTSGAYDYANLTAAVFAYNNSCLGGAIIFELMDAAYTTSAIGEAFPITINANADASSTNTLTIRPAAGVATTITSNAADVGVIKMLNAKYVTIDGLNTGGSSLTLTNANTTTASAVIWMASTVTTGPGNSNIAIKNLTLNGGSNTVTTSFGIVAGVNGAAPSTTGGLDNDNINIEGNTILKSYYGIYANGAGSVSAGGLDALTIISNVIGPVASSADNIGFSGINIGNAVAPSVTLNTIQNIAATATGATGIQTTVSVAGALISQNTIQNLTTTVPLLYGIFLNGTGGTYSVSRNIITGLTASAGTNYIVGIETLVSGGSTIERNNISTISNNASGTFGAYGINLNGGSGHVVKNNFVSGVTGVMTGGAAFTTVFGIFGIRIGTGSSHLIHHNSVNLFGLRPGGAASSLLGAAFCIVGTGSLTCDVRNNIFTNTMTGGTTSIAYPSMYLPTGGGAGMGLILNSNAYYTGSTAGVHGINQGGTSYVFPVVSSGIGLFTVANFIPTATSPVTNLRSYTSLLGTASNDNASMAFATAAPFTTDNDLHLLAAGSVLKAGTPIGSVTTDFDNDARNLVVPAIGADEILVNGFWTGTISTVWDGAVTGNWDDGAIPAGGANIVVPAGVINSPVLTGISPSIGNLNLETGKTLSINGNSPAISGAITGTGTITGSSTSNLTMGGVSTLNMTQTNAATRSLNNFTIQGATASITLGNAVDIFDRIQLVSGASLNMAAQAVTLKSNATNTARITDLTGQTLTGASNVTMERWIKLRLGGTGRAYRLLTPTVNTIGSMNANWMEGGVNTAIGTNVNPVALFGTQITGAGGDVNGFDKTQSNAASIYATANAVTPTYTAITNSSGTLNALTGYFMYVRGDRSMDMQIPLAVGMPTSSTTLRARGAMLQGTQTTFTNPLLAGAGVKNLITNPYPSAIDWSMVYGASTDITTSYTFWDPNFSTRGGFVTVNTAGVASSGLATQFIQSGQAFFVEALNATPPTVSIQEGHKSNNNNNDVFLVPPPPIESFKTDLYFTEPNGFRRIADGAIAVYKNSYSAAVNAKEDASEINNWDENIAIARDGKRLAIESRPVIGKYDDLPIFMNNMKKQAYEFEFTPVVFTNTSLKAELIDNFLGTRTLLSVTAPTVVAFTITADARSSATDRFKVVFGAFGSPTGVDAITIKASQTAGSGALNGGVQVDWTAKTETDMVRYEVEKSTYGTTFAKANSTAALGNSTLPVNYNWFDTNPNMGTNFYRIKGIDKAGNVRYSEMVRVLFGKGEPSIVVYPNPVEGTTFKMDMYNLVKGTYVLNLYSNDGRLVHTEQLQHDGSQATKTINLKGDMASGSYQLQLMSHNGFKTTRIIFKN